MSGPVATDAFHLMVLKGFSGEIHRVEIAPSDTVQQVLSIIADAISYETGDWERIGLYNLTQDFEYAADDTLASRDTRTGDLVVIADGTACHK